MTTFPGAVWVTTGAAEGVMTAVPSKLPSGYVHRFDQLFSVPYSTSINQSGWGAGVYRISNFR